MSERYDDDYYEVDDMDADIEAKKELIKGITERRGSGQSVKQSEFITETMASDSQLGIRL